MSNDIKKDLINWNAEQLSDDSPVYNSKDLINALNSIMPSLGSVILTTNNHILSKQEDWDSITMNTLNMFTTLANSGLPASDFPNNSGVLLVLGYTSYNIYIAISGEAVYYQLGGADWNKLLTSETIKDLTGSVTTLTDNLSKLSDQQTTLNSLFNTFKDGTTKQLDTLNAQSTSQAKMLEDINNQLVKLNETYNQVNNEFKGRGVNVKWFGAVGDGTTDDTKAIQQAINNGQNNEVIFPQGYYLITSPLIIGSSVTLDLHSAHIVAGATMNTCIQVGETSKVVTNVNIRGNSSSRIDGNLKASRCISMVGEVTKSYVSGLTITDPQDTAITIDKGYEMFWRDLHIESTHQKDKLDNVGIEINTSDCAFSDIIMIGMHTGLISNGTSNTFTNLHMWVYGSNILIGSVGILINNANGCKFRDLFFDTYETCYFIKNKSYFNISDEGYVQNLDMYPKGGTFNPPTVFKVADGVVLDNNAVTIMGSRYNMGVTSQDSFTNYAKPDTAFRMIGCSVWNANNIPLSAK